MSKEYDYLYKLLLIGPAGCGKSCLLLKYTDNSFSTAYISTIGVDFKIKTENLGGKNVKMQIWDTAGQERFRTITSSYYRGANGMLVVFDITNAESFKEIDSFIDEGKKSGNDGVKMMLVGNCCDKESQRQVTYQEAMDKANKYGISYMEASAANGNNVNQIFTTLAEMIMNNIKPEAVAKPPTIIPQVLNVVPSMKPAEENKEKPAGIVQPEPDKTEQVKLMEKKLESIEAIIKIMGAEGSLMVENIKKVLNAKEGF